MSQEQFVWATSLALIWALIWGILGFTLATPRADPGFWAPMGADWIMPPGISCYAWEGSYTNPMTGKDGGEGQPGYLLCTVPTSPLPQ